MSNVQIKKVRLSFPALFKPEAFDKDKEPKYKASFILDKKANAADIATLRKAIQAVIAEQWGPKPPKGIKVCLREGTEREVDGYGPDVMFINASSGKKIPVVDTDWTPLDIESDKPYAGCYVNASLRLWAQDNEWGKKVNCALRAVRFIEDGDPFGEAPLSEDDLRRELGDGGEDGDVL